MAYNKYTWKSGDVISSARLNNIEDGIEEAMSSGGGVMIVNVTKGEEGYTADKTFDEIEAAIDGGQTVIVKYQPENTGGVPITETVYLTLKRTSIFNGIKEEKYFTFEGGINERWTRIYIGTDDIDVSEFLEVIETEISHALDGTDKISYSKVDITYEDIIDNDNYGIKLLVRDTDKTMAYTINEFYPNDQVIAFSGAGKVGPLYMDKDGNISETYPTSGEGGKA